MLLRPRGDLGLEPELHAPLAKVYNGPWHIGMPMLVHADGVRMAQPERSCDTTRVEQLVNIHLPTHVAQVTAVVNSVRPQT